MQQGRVALAYAVEAGRTDQSLGGLVSCLGVEGRKGETMYPDYRRAKHRAAVGAGEGARLVGAADVVNVAQHPKRNTRLCQGAEDGGEALREKDCTRG